MNGNNNRRNHEVLREETSAPVRLEDTQCGCPPICAPRWIQWLANPKVFTAHMAVLLSFLLISGLLLGATLTTIERNFQLDSSESGSLVFSSDIVSTVLVVPLSHYGQRGHRARWIASGLMLSALGNFLCAMPHFLSDPIDSRALLTGSSDDVIFKPDVCHADGATHHYETNPDDFNSNMSVNHSIGMFDDGDTEDIAGVKKGSVGSLWWIILGQIILGIGTAPLFPLIITYIDDSVKKHNLTSYTAVLFMSFTIGPACGFLLAAFTTSKYVDFDRVPADEIPNIDQSDPRWIGAWWLGFVMLSVIMFVLTLPVFFYPRSMRIPSKKDRTEVELTDVNSDEQDKNQNEVDDEHDDDKLRERSGSLYSQVDARTVEVVIKGPVMAVKRLLTNVTNMWLIAFGTIFMANIAVFVSFGLKYMQTQYGLSPAEAAVFISIILGPSNILSQIVSGFICRRFKLNMKQCALFCLIGLGVGCVLTPFGFLLGCNNPPIAGVTSTYDGQPTLAATIMNDCNTDCACSEEVFQPVCGSNGLNYISPCHAGCMGMDTNLSSSNSSTGPVNPFMKHVYHDCRCISNGTSGMSPNLATESPWTGINSSSPADTEEAFSGQCPEECPSIKPYIILFTVITFLQSSTQNPGMYIGLRCVGDEDRSVAIGLRSAIGKIIGFFPAPVYFGAIVNSLCIHWQYTDGERGACWFYDRAGLRHAYIGFETAVNVVGLLCLFMVYFTIKEDLCAPKKSIPEIKIETRPMADPDSSYKLMRDEDNIPTNGNNYV